MRKIKADITVFFIAVTILVFAALPPPLSAQDGFADQSFGFGGMDADTSAGAGAGFGGGNALAVSIGGEAEARMLGFFDDFADGADHTRLGDIFSGKLNFKADASRGAAVINLKFAPGLVYYDHKSPVYIDEAYITGYFGSLDVEGGLRKLTWGKADSTGPLDVINPQDSSDLSVLRSDPASAKIARPLVHLSLRLGQFSKLEGVFVPNFEPARFAGSGRWAIPGMAALAPLQPDTTTLDYAQAGMRFTTTIMGAADIGAQYYYGRLTTPAVNMAAGSVAYNPYHQIGVDYAQVLAGFNLRAEFAANITEDISGDDGGVYNPSLAWSLGFDRDLFWGINLNAQCNETIRLLDDAIDAPYDIEADSDITSTRIIAALSKKFLRDELEAGAAVLWEAESGACLVMPSLIWTKDDLAVELSAGIFAGSDKGFFGQFRDNNFIKAGVKYTF